MNTAKRFTALIMSFILAFTACVVAAADDVETTVTLQDETTTLPEIEEIEPPVEYEIYDAPVNTEEYKELLVRFDRPVVTTDQYLYFMKIINFISRLMTGRVFCPEEHLNVLIDDYIYSVSEEVYNESGLHLSEILMNLPDINGLAELNQRIINLDTAEFRRQMYEKRDELWENGEKTKSNFYHLFGAYFSIMEKIELTAEPTNDPNVSRVKMTLYYHDGGTEEMKLNFYINSETGEIYSPNNKGVLGIGFNFNLEQMVVYATSDAWMRDFGFCVLYDIAAGMAPPLWNYNTRRFHFDYDGLEWMVQVWKGNYLISNGSEVGLYNREPGSFGTFYNCATDEQMVPMSMKLYAGDNLLVDMPRQLHWWINGFRINGEHYPASSLTLVFTIEMRDEEMRDAFLESVRNHPAGDVSYVAEGLKVTVTW